MVSCNNHSAANKRLRIRKALSSSPRKSESGAPISKAVLYPALLQYIGRKMVKSSNNTERTNHFERKTSSQPTSQHPPCQEPNLLERNVTHRAQRTQSNVTEELRRRKVLVEQAMMNDVRNGGNNIERPLRRSRSSTSALMRTKPRTMTHSQLVEQSVARKINQIRASPTYKQLEVRSSTDRNSHSKALLNSSLNTGLGEQLTEDYAAQPLIESRRKESRNFPSNSATPTLSSQIPRFLS
ncbi:unnamed protein product, partial [Anisakis simplex]|uniref:Uncharacterized protein n=1 Tax=Anisakis simplex TaxID=6269 RepID=A0A0M3K3B3_ANISI